MQTLQQLAISFSSSSSSSSWWLLFTVVAILLTSYYLFKRSHRKHSWSPTHRFRPSSSSTTSTPLRRHVVIIGAGPVGVTVAALLSKYENVNITVLDKQKEIWDFPRAGALHSDALRVLQWLGLTKTLDLVFDLDICYVTGRDPTPITELPVQHTPFGFQTFGFFFQPQLEAQLRALLDRQSNVQLLLGDEFNCTEIDLESGSVTCANGSRWQADFILGCDGARSTVRKQLAEYLHLQKPLMESLGPAQRWIVCDTVPDPSTTSTTSSSSSSQLDPRFRFGCGPARPFVTGPLACNHYRMEVLLYPNERNLDEDTINALLKESFGEHVLQNRIVRRKAEYKLHALIASHWGCITRSGTYLGLAGDAAHMMPPFAAHGLSSGIRDASNLAFKIGMIASGQAPMELMDTYPLERKPHAMRVVRQSLFIASLMETKHWLVWRARNLFFKTLATVLSQQNFRRAMHALGALDHSYQGYFQHDYAGAGLPFPQCRCTYAEDSSSSSSSSSTTTADIGIDEVIPWPHWSVLYLHLLADTDSRKQWTDQMQQISRLAVPFTQLVDTNSVKIDRGDELGRLGVTLISIPPHQREWMNHHLNRSKQCRTASAIVVRPDKYVYGIANSVQQLSTLLQQLQFCSAPAAT